MNKIGIVMMTYFSGKSFKAAQMPEIIHRLSEDGQLGLSYGLPYQEDSSVYSMEELSYLKRSSLCRIVFAVLSNFNKRILRIPHVYQTYESVYGFFAKLYYRKQVPEIAVMKPRPSFLIEHMKKKGACVIVEASENHTRFTCEQIQKEAASLGVEIKESNYVDEKAISDYEKGIHLADGLICLSEFSKKTYVDRGFPADKIRVVPLNIELPVDQPQKRDDELIFVSVAMHSLLKGTYRLIKVWKDYKIKSKLVIVGAIDQELQKLINELGPVENVEFWGYKSYSYMREFYCSHRCVGILLSFSESFGRTIYECMCTSTPVIVTPYCTLDMVKDGVNGCIVEPAREDEIFSAVHMFEKLSSNDFYQYQENVYQTVCEHHIDFGKTYVEAVNELAAIGK